MRRHAFRLQSLMLGNVEGKLHRINGLHNQKFIIDGLVRKRVVDNRIGDSKAGYPHTCTSFFVFVQFFSVHDMSQQNRQMKGEEV